MGLAVVKVAAGGLPVTIATTGGLPCTEATNGYGIAVTEAPNGLPVSGITFGPDVTAPTITSSNTVSNVENSVLAHTLTANEAVTWAIVAGGADNARFELSGSTLRWLSNGVKDFEAPNDADTNNTYVVTVRATDLAANPSVAQTITVTVTDMAAVAPTAPVLDLTSDASDNTPDFTLTGDLALGDTVRFQYSTSAVFSGASELTNAIDSSEDAANAISFATGALANNTWYFRARIERPDHANSDWSNTETITIAAGSTLKTGLVSFWELSEASGITRADSVVASANNLTDNNTVTQGAPLCATGNSAQFTAASSQFLSCADNASLNAAGTDFSIAGWIRFDSFAADVAWASKMGGFGNREWRMSRVFDGGHKLFFGIVDETVSSSEYTVQANTFGGIGTGVPYFVVGTFVTSTGAIKISVNAGAQDSSTLATGAMVNGNGPFQIGAINSGLFFNGRVQRVGFWNKALTTTEITQLYAGGSGLSYAEM